MPYPILDPTGTTTTAARPGRPAARRPPGLRGATVGLLVNTKQNAAPFLDEVGRLLIEQYGATLTMARTKVNFAAPAPDDLVKEWWPSCDVIITGIGDCGSCSASAVADGIVFEAAGVPAAAIMQRRLPPPPTRWPNCAARPATVRHHARTRWPCSPRTRSRSARRRSSTTWSPSSPTHRARMTDETPEGSGALGAPEAPDPDEAQRAIEYCYAQGWSDGLPLVPASQPLLDRFLATTDKEPGRDHRLPRAGRPGRATSTAAINAAMAGCKPEYFPVVLAAFDALMRERAARGGGFQSTSGPAPLIVVNGPIRKELGFNTAGGAFGPGFRPNMTIPRAIGLIVRNAFGIRPHVLEQATQGVPGRWSICVAENEEESPWQPFAENGGAGWRRLARCPPRSLAPWSSSTTGTPPTPRTCCATSRTRSAGSAR